MKMIFKDEQPRSKLIALGENAGKIFRGKKYAIDGRVDWAGSFNNLILPFAGNENCFMI